MSSMPSIEEEIQMRRQELRELERKRDAKKIAELERKIALYEQKP